ncbi:hypothetical protein C0J52_02559 [Blattella germanica]|nr:hypothetical protein C0J52_02559 [Blattella germanica]
MEHEPSSLSLDTGTGNEENKCPCILLKIATTRQDIIGSLDSTAGVRSASLFQFPLPPFSSVAIQR